jgi:tetratricopeptide (TPR) repeat protein
VSFISDQYIEDESAESKWLRLIIQLHNEGKYEDALKIIGEKENKVDYLFLKGLCLFKLGNYIDTLSYFIALYNKIRDPDIDLYINNCREHLNGKEVEFRSNAKESTDKHKKLEYLNKAIEINPTYDGANNDKGFVLASLNKLDEAIICFNRAIEINPNFITAYNNKGSTLISLRQFDEGLKILKMALELDSHCANIHFNIGMALIGLNEFDQAVVSLNKAIELNPNQPHNYSSKGNSFIILQRFNEALECFNKAIELNPNQYNTYISKGDCFLNLKRFDEALEFTKPLN